MSDSFKAARQVNIPENGSKAREASPQVWSIGCAENYT